MFGVPGICSGSQNGSTSVGPGGRVVEVAGRVVVRVGDGAVLGGRGRRPEPRAVHPAAVGAQAAGVAGVLRRHVHVVVPEVAVAAPAGLVPGRILAVAGGVAGVRVVELRVLRHEGAVLDDQRDLVGRDGAAVDERLSPAVGDQVAGGLTRVHVEARDAPGVVVVEEQPRALLVGVVEGLDAVVGDVLGRHVGHVADGDALRPRGGLVGRGDPLVRRTVADPRAGAAVEVQGGAVVLEAVRRLGRLGADRVAHLVHHGALVDRVGQAHGTHAGAHEVLSVGRKRSPFGAGRQQVAEHDADRLVLGGDEGRAEPLRRGDARRPAAPLIRTGDLGAVEQLVGQRIVLADRGVGTGVSICT